jgi:hypothetical protein
VTPRRLIGVGWFTGFGIGQTSAWLFLRGHCLNAPGMIALSTFGPGMTVVGVVWMVYLFRRRNSAR